MLMEISLFHSDLEAMQHSKHQHCAVCHMVSRYQVDVEEAQD